MKQSKHGITWCDHTWNPIRGCSAVSEGCRNCYAERMAARFAGPGQPYEGLAVTGLVLGPKWTGIVRLIPHLLNAPIRWKEPCRIFVNSMSDLFHQKLMQTDIERVFSVMAACPRHTFQVLTKRPARMQQFIKDLNLMHLCGHTPGPVWSYPSQVPTSALDHVWLGVSCEDQDTANQRIPILIDTKIAVRFVSCEPLLGPIDLSRWLPTGSKSTAASIQWVIAGSETGPHARPMKKTWVRSLKDQCVAAHVPFFFKQEMSQKGQRISLPFLDARQWTQFPKIVGNLTSRVCRAEQEDSR